MSKWMSKQKAAVSQVLMHWRECSLVLSHQNVTAILGTDEIIAPKRSYLHKLLSILSYLSASTITEQILTLYVLNIIVET